MQPTLLTPPDISRYLDGGHWTKETQAKRFAYYATVRPKAVACQDPTGAVTWAELDAATDQLAANLVDLGLSRDSRALVRMPSGYREVVTRIALKKAGIIGAFVPMQWRLRELDYVRERIAPELFIMTTADSNDEAEREWAETAFCGFRVDPTGNAKAGWCQWSKIADQTPAYANLKALTDRAFAYDEVSLITASSGTSGLAKLCEWPEAAQMCIGRAIGARLSLTAEDTVGIFSPLSGAAGVLVWLVSGTTPAKFVFPPNYHPSSLLDLTVKTGVTVATTVPVILARLAQEPLANYDLTNLRALRIGTAAADTDAAYLFENGADCRVVVAAGSMECPGFAHADFNEDKETRLSGAIGLRLPGCRTKIVDGDGHEVQDGEIGELMVSAPYAASGYWNDDNATQAAWSDGWFATGDMGCLLPDGRLRLMGRRRETINRSGLKILPAEVERELSRHPSVFECAVVAASDKEYGEVPWAFIQLQPDHNLSSKALVVHLRNQGMANYKTPVRFIAVDSFPRVADNKIDKKSLMETVLV